MGFLGRVLLSLRILELLIGTRPYGCLFGVNLRMGSSTARFAKEARDDVSHRVILNEVKNLALGRLRSFIPQDDKTFDRRCEGA